jgi:hypothetical protein
MKTTIKFSIVLALTLLISIVGVSVWAAPSPQGTVPATPLIIPLTGIIPVTGGTFNVSLLCGCTNEGSSTRITDPEKEIGKAPAGFAFISDALKVELDGACDIEVCYPYPNDYEAKKGQIYIWNAVNKAWGLATSTIYGDPKQICTVDKASTGNTYSLITSDKIYSLETPSKVTLCGCSADDKITSIIDPKTNVGAAPAGLTILTDATQVVCQKECEVKVCFPYTAEYKSKNGQIYEWDKTKSTWNLFKSTISGDPAQICALNESSTGGIFTLIGK